MLKWPNDLLVGGAKLAGILLERTGDHVVVGVGVNLVAAPQLPDRATISVAETGHAVDRDVFAATLAECFDVVLKDWRTKGMVHTVSEWESRAHPRGTALTASEGPDAGTVGLFDGLDGEGALRLRRGAGDVLLIHAGEIGLAPERG
jgi:BirA family biotin operon repressor/biotin-[acetyl-CoA-carboxylase] ligase